MFWEVFDELTEDEKMDFVCKYLDTELHLSKVMLK